MKNRTRKLLLVIVWALAAILTVISIFSPSTGIEIAVFVVIVAGSGLQFYDWYLERRV